jgi:hypothetical protein
LRAYAKKTFELSVLDADGASYREILEGLIARTSNADRRAEYQAELDCPPLPEPLLYLWNAFCRLSARRGSNGFCANPISWPELDAFLRHAGVTLAPWEIRILEDLDDLFRQAQANTNREA